MGEKPRDLRRRGGVIQGGCEKLARVISCRQEGESAKIAKDGGSGLANIQASGRSASGIWKTEAAQIAFRPRIPKCGLVTIRGWMFVRANLSSLAISAASYSWRHLITIASFSRPPQATTPTYVDPSLFLVFPSHPRFRRAPRAAPSALCTRCRRRCGSSRSNCGHLRDGVWSPGRCRAAGCSTPGSRVRSSSRRSRGRAGR